MVIDENISLEEIQRFFGQDRFAVDACGCRVLEGRRGHSVCAFTIGDEHKNARGGIMGGAIFTLADFALAVACNIGEQPTVAVNNSIQYFNASRGTQLIATCNVEKSGRTLGFYTVDIVDDLDVPIAKMTATCFRRSK